MDKNSSGNFNFGHHIFVSSYLWHKDVFPAKSLCATTHLLASNIVIFIDMEIPLFL
jgi:hypothetical protein